MFNITANTSEQCAAVDLKFDQLKAWNSARCPPEMVAPEAVLDAALEFPEVGAPVGAGLRADAVALAAGPLAGVAVAAVEPVDAVAVAEALAVLAAVPAATRPALDPVAVVLAVDPVALVLSLAEEVVDAAAVAAALVELALVAVPIAVELDALAHDAAVRRGGAPVRALLGLVVVVADEPLHGPGARGAAEAKAAAEQARGPRRGGERCGRGCREEGEVVAVASSAAAEQEEDEEEGEREREDEERVCGARVEVVGRGLGVRRLGLLVVGLRVLDHHGLERGAVPHRGGAEQRGGRPRQLPRAAAGARRDADAAVAVHPSAAPGHSDSDSPPPPLRGPDAAVPVLNLRRISVSNP
ncbi:unnamed protein product [Urochloa decumbens]|uniref:Uncharacterized protein n=1 Tax=Urochloa decumbens TaxID=240449 RepID=A0ABC9FED1_9POAL